MNMPAQQTNSHIDQGFYQFVNQELLPHSGLAVVQFWQQFGQLIAEFTPRNQQLLQQRNTFNQRIAQYHQQQPRYNAEHYLAFLGEIGYLQPTPAPFTIETSAVDDEIARLAGPQLVVPVKNARFALNAANARWGSLYDALYGTDAIAEQGELSRSQGYNPKRGEAVIRYAKDFLDQHFALAEGSHHQVRSYAVNYHHLVAFLDDGRKTTLSTPQQFVAYDCDDCGCCEVQDLDSIVLKHNGLHVEIVINRGGVIGKQDRAGVDDILLESALTTIMDLEDSIAAVDASDKIEAYRNWLGLNNGSLSAVFDKNGERIERRLVADRKLCGANGQSYALRMRALMLVRNVGLLMRSELMVDAHGEPVFEGIIDAVITALIAKIGRDSALQNSRTGSIYIVKPKLHGPDEVAFTCDLFAAVERLLGLETNCIKIGIMDEERRTSLNLAACIEAAKQRVVFINTGFLDRTGDEIHSNQYAGAFAFKPQLKNLPWLAAYEQHNVAVGIAAGLPGRAQIGKGMWAMPDEMAQMLAQKAAHPRAGANTAWVPSPTAATLHALHYHQVDVKAQVAQLQQLPADLEALRVTMCQLPLLQQMPTLEQIEQELANNLQGILGYVVRWVDQGIGCSKVPDINHIGLMEDRATLRISSQHVANWLLHGICSKTQVETIMAQMAQVVDGQNASDANYQPMSPNLERSLAYRCAHALVFQALEQPNGYTEPLLHQYRQQVKHQLAQ